MMMIMKTWRWLGAVGLLVLSSTVHDPLLYSAQVVTAAPSAASPAIAPDAWSPPITWRTADGWYAAPVYIGLLPDGKVVLMGIARPTATPGPTTPLRPIAFTMT